MRITLIGEDTPETRDHLANAFVAIDEVVGIMSEWEIESDISRVNRAAGGAPVAVNSRLLDVVTVALEVAELSLGAFDPTWAAFREVWCFDVGCEPPADIDRLEAARRVDYTRVLADQASGTISLVDPGMALGLGGIAKGYAIRAAAKTLEVAGYDSFLIEAGGDVYAHGRALNDAWWVGIASPRSEDLLDALILMDGALVTSGDYERYFESNGVRYHHILDPATGLPARSLISVSVWCADPTLADALATATFVLGMKAGLDFIGRWEGAEALIVDEDHQVWATAGWPGTQACPLTGSCRMNR